MRATMNGPFMHTCGGEGGIRTHEHPLRCYWNSSPAPSTARPPLRSMTCALFLERLECASTTCERARIIKHAADGRIRGGGPQAWGTFDCCGTLNEGGSSRQGW